MVGSRCVYVLNDRIVITTIRVHRWETKYRMKIYRSYYFDAIYKTYSESVWSHAWTNFKLKLSRANCSRTICWLGKLYNNRYDVQYCQWRCNHLRCPWEFLCTQINPRFQNSSNKYIMVESSTSQQIRSSKCSYTTITLVFSTSKLRMRAFHLRWTKPRKPSRLPHATLLELSCLRQIISPLYTRVRSVPSFPKYV